MEAYTQQSDSIFNLLLAMFWVELCHLPMPATSKRGSTKEAEDGLATLSTRAANGDQQAFRLLVECTTPLIYRLALYIVGNESEAEDVVQQAYVHAWQGLPLVQDHNAALSWLCAVARNAAKDRLKQLKRRPAEVVSLDDDRSCSLARHLVNEDSDPEELLASNETCAFVRAAIASLPEKHRVVLMLKEIDDLSYGEIAAALGCPQGTVESRIHRARRALKKKMLSLASPRRWRR